MDSPCPFVIYYDGDAYSTASKIMGRQAAGKAFMKGIARTWPRGLVRGTGPRPAQAKVMAKQLRDDGFTGPLQWCHLPDWRGMAETGMLYYPAPPPRDLAAARNADAPAAFSVVGVTHSLSSSAAAARVADLLLPPFQSWDALICTSHAARDFVRGMHADLRAWWREQTGATRFADVQLPIIPLGIDAPSFATSPAARASARSALAIADDTIVFLFAGRLAFHAKANPAPLYQALEKVARAVDVVCIEAGVFPDGKIRASYTEAQQALAPSVRFVHAEGQQDAYQRAWQAADVFVSPSDNIQETFGLTPVEAMAAGLPVVVSDWNGYKDTVRDGIDGFRIPTHVPPPMSGSPLAMRHALGVDTYDAYVGRASMATVVEPNALTQALLRLATDADLRRTMGAAGRARARQDFDWPVILRQYAELATQLHDIRVRHAGQAPTRWPPQADPFLRFAHFASGPVKGNAPVVSAEDALARLPLLLSLTMTNYVHEDPALLAELLRIAATPGKHTVGSLLTAAAQSTPAGLRAVMWLWKFDLIRIG